jgi:hypothetical protein
MGAWTGSALSAEEMQIHVMSEEDVISHPFIISQVNVANSTISSWLAPQIWPLFCSNMNFAHLTLKSGTNIDMDQASSSNLASFCSNMNFAHLTLKSGTNIDMDHLFPRSVPSSSMYLYTSYSITTRSIPICPFVRLTPSLHNLHPSSFCR